MTHTRIIKRKNTQTCPKVELYTYYSMDKQYVEGVQNEKKAYLLIEGKISMWLYHSMM